jgi:hypothetical protein
VTTHTFQFRRFPTEQAQRLRGGPAWGRRSLLSLAAGSTFLLGGAAYWVFQPETATVLMLVGLGLLIFSAVALCAWFWRLVRAPHRPWGRLMLVSLFASWALDTVAQQQHAVAWAAALGALQWVLLIGLVLRFLGRGKRLSAQDDAARWEAGARGETIVADALAKLEADHVVINNLPILGRGDADHVVVGPAGVVVVETKYLAGRISCLGDGTWMQTKRDEVRQIADPAAQVQRAAAAIEAKLRRRGLWDVPVHAVLVLAHPHAELEVERSSVPVVRAFELVPLLRRLARKRAQLNGAAVAATANALLDARGLSVHSQEGGRYARV